jgi:hypothetical protein
MVRIRDDQLRPVPGVRIKDLGPKMGLNGVDNGQLWFDNLRVPRDAMLDAFSTVDDAGTFHSTIPSVSQRFGTMVGGLTTGEWGMSERIQQISFCLKESWWDSSGRPFKLLAVGVFTPHPSPFYLSARDVFTSPCSTHS